MNLSQQSYFFILLFAIVSVSVTQVIFKIVADKNKDYLINVIYDYRLYIALIIYVIAFVLWIVALSKIDFSIAIPLNIITILLGGAFGYFLFGEQISSLKLSAYFVIALGIAMLAYDAFKV